MLKQTFIFTRKALSYFYNTIVKKIASYYLYLNNIMVNKNTKCNGIPFIRNYGSISIGSNTTITSSHNKNPIDHYSKSVFITEKTGTIIIGSNTGISNSYFYAVNGIYIGDNVMIGAGCRIYDTDFHSLDSNKRSEIMDKGNNKPIRIENNVFIGASSLILKGVSIGEKSVVGANSVVTKTIPKNELWAGNPAKKIRTI